MQPQQAQRSGSTAKGCLIAVAIAATFGMVLLVLAGVGVYRLMQDPDVSTAFRAFGSMVDAAGRSELQAAGCDLAMVMDMRPLADLAQKSGNSTDKEIAFMRETVAVNCLTESTKANLDCAALARVYAKAVGAAAPAQIQVVVQSHEQERPSCAGRYDANGTYIGKPVEAPRSVQVELGDRGQAAPPAVPIDEPKAP